MIYLRKYASPSSEGLLTDTSDLNHNKQNWPIKKTQVRTKRVGHDKNGMP